MATGVSLPRSATICETHFGSRRLGRLASWTHQQNKPNQASKLDHVLEQVMQKKVVRFCCIVCSRSCAKGERSRFMKSSCAGYTETPNQAMRRMKLERDASRCSSKKPLPTATLHEKYIVFADMVDSFARHQLCYFGDKILTCRSLAPLGLPKSSGLSRRPILMCQEQVTAELQHCAEALPHKLIEADSLPKIKQPAWATHCALFHCSSTNPVAASSCSGLGRLCWWTWRASANSCPRHNEGLRERTCRDQGQRDPYLEWPDRAYGSWR